MRALLSLLAFTAVLLAARSSSADRATAEFYAQRGDQAAKAKDWTAAQGHYRKALEEDDAYLPARAGLAEAFLGAGDRQAAVEELRRFAPDGEAVREVPAAWTALVARMRKRLAEVDAAGTQLEQIAEGYVTELMAVGERWAQKDPEVAATAFREVRRLRPSHVRAMAGLEKIEKADLARRVVLFDGKDRKGWVSISDQRWTLAGGVLVGDSPGQAMLGRTEAVFRGDFDVRMEAQILETHGHEKASSQLFFLSAVKGDYRHTSYGIQDGELFWSEVQSNDPKDIVTQLQLRPDSLSPPFDPKAWTWYEMRFRGDRAHALVNGLVVGTFARGKDSDEGSVGFRLQNVKAAIRRVDFLQR